MISLGNNDYKKKTIIITPSKFVYHKKQARRKPNSQNHYPFGMGEGGAHSVPINSMSLLIAFISLHIFFMLPNCKMWGWLQLHFNLIFCMLIKKMFAGRRSRRGWGGAAFPMVRACKPFLISHKKVVGVTTICFPIQKYWRNQRNK